MADRDQISSVLDSLADMCALKPGQSLSDVPEVLRSQRLYRLLSVVQTRPEDFQDKIFHGMAAKHLPTLVDRYKENEGALNSSMTMINVLTHTPYFVQFMASEAAGSITTIQAHRMANDEGDINVDGIGEICQFLSTLIVLQGVGQVDAQDRGKLLPKLRQWRTLWKGRLAGETSDRCLRLLTNDMIYKAMGVAMKEQLETPLFQCGAAGCRRCKGDGGPEMMQCSRCRARLYCGAVHQRQHWPSHKPLCFPNSALGGSG